MAPPGAGPAAAGARPGNAPGATSEALRAAFGILRRRAVPADRPPARALRLLARESRFEAAVAGSSLDLSSLRKLSLPGAPPSWTLTGPGRLCLLRTEPLDAGPSGYTLDCVHAAAALDGFLLSDSSQVPGYRGRTLVEGLLPDGASDVELLREDGPAVRPDVVGNGYFATVREPLSLAFRLAAAPHLVAVPRRPALPGGPAGRDRRGASG